MGFDLNKIATDGDAEVNGVWTPDLGDGLKLKIARINNPHYAREVMRFAKEHTNAFNTLDIDADEDDEALIKIYAQTILLDWEGLEEDGKEVVYSIDEAFRIMHKYRDFYLLVKTEASKVEYFRLKKIEEDSGN